MRLNEINLSRRTLITEGWNDPRLTLLETQHLIPFITSVERYIVEANLNPQQISQLFTDVEAGATAGGGNRNALGKGTDAVKFVNTKMKELGQAVKKTGPVQNADAKFAELKAKIGAEDSKVVQAIQGVSDWAKENPGKATIAVSILTVAAGMAGGPLGGAIGGFLMRATKDLLQGKDLSSAVGSSLKTAAVGALVGVISNNIDFGAQDVEGGINTVGLETDGGDIVDAVGDAADGAPVEDILASLTQAEYTQEMAEKLYNAQIERFGGKVSESMITKIADSIEVSGSYPDNFSAKIDGSFIRGSIFLNTEEASELAKQGFTGTEIMSDEASDWLKNNVEGYGNNASDFKVEPSISSSPDVDNDFGPEGGDQTSAEPETAGSAEAETTAGFDSSMWTQDEKELVELLKAGAAEGGDPSSIIGDYVDNNPPANYSDLSSTISEYEFFVKNTLGINPGSNQPEELAKAFSELSAAESVNFKPLQIETIIEWCDLTPAVMLTEGPLDAIKKGAAAAGGAIKKGAAAAGQAAGGAIKKGAAAAGAKAATVGKNITTKVTADKLNSAWKKAGSPTDSDAVANILRQQGVDDKVLAPVYKTLGAKLPAVPVAAPAAAPGAKPGPGGKPAGAKPAAAPGAKPGPGGKPAAGAAAGAAAPKAAAATMDFKSIQQAVAKLTPVDAKALVTHIDSLGSKPAAAPGAKPAAAPNTAAKPAQANAAPSAQPATQDATAAPTAPGQAPTAKPAAAPAAPALSSYFQNFSKSMKGASDKNQKIALAKELVNTVADRGGEDSETAVSVLRKFGGELDNNFKQAAMNALKTGQRLLKQSVYYEINKMLKEHDLRWSDLGMRVHLLEGTNKLIGISLI